VKYILEIRVTNQNYTHTENKIVICLLLSLQKCKD